MCNRDQLRILLQQCHVTYLKMMLSESGLDSSHMYAIDSAGYQELLVDELELTEDSDHPLDTLDMLDTLDALGPL